MVTNQIMKREFYDGVICQRTKDSFFNATDLLKRFNEISGSSKVFAEFWSNKTTITFLEVLQNDLVTNVGNPLYLNCYETTRGNKGSTWMHPYLFVKFAMWLSPEFELKIIKWVYDNLIDFRIQSGDHYKEMCKVLADNYEDINGKKADPFYFVKEANFLNMLVFGNTNSNQRNEATPQQLDKMNKLQLANIKMINLKVPKKERFNNLKIFSELY
jgi:hypothetical protein